MENQPKEPNIEDSAAKINEGVEDPEKETDTEVTETESPDSTESMENQEIGTVLEATEPKTKDSDSMENQEKAEDSKITENVSSDSIVRNTEKDNSSQNFFKVLAIAAVAVLTLLAVLCIVLLAKVSAADAKLNELSSLNTKLDSLDTINDTIETSIDAIDTKIEDLKKLDSNIYNRLSDDSSCVLVVYFTTSDDDYSDSTQTRNALKNGGMIHIRLNVMEKSFGNIDNYGASDSEGYYYTKGAALNYIGNQGWTLVGVDDAWYYFVR